MRRNKKLLVKYRIVECTEMDRQKRLDDAFNVIFEEIESDDIERTNSKGEYEHDIVIKR